MDFDLIFTFQWQTASLDVEQVRNRTIERAIASHAFNKDYYEPSSIDFKSISSRFQVGWWLTFKRTIEQFEYDLPFCCALLSLLSPSNVSFSAFLKHFILEWVGDLDSENAGRLGLWQVCQRDETSDNCQKQLADFLSIPSIPFQVIVVFSVACCC